MNLVSSCAYLSGVQIMIGLMGSGPIHFSNVNCIGNETNLLNCTYLTTHNCEHYRDAGVICTAGMLDRFFNAL